MDGFVDEDFEKLNKVVEGKKKISFAELSETKNTDKTEKRQTFPLRNPKKPKRGEVKRLSLMLESVLETAAKRVIDNKTEMGAWTACNVDPQQVPLSNNLSVLVILNNMF